MFSHPVGITGLLESWIVPNELYGTLFFNTDVSADSTSHNYDTVSLSFHCYIELVLLLLLCCVC